MSKFLSELEDKKKQIVEDYFLQQREADKYYIRDTKMALIV